MLRQFKDGGFIGGTGPSISTLQRRTFARQDKMLSTIIPQQSSNYNEKNVEIVREQVSSGLDSDSGCSPPRIKKKMRKNQKVSKSVAAK